MLVYRCPRCGNEYTKDMVSKSEVCPFCDANLKIINISDENDASSMKKYQTTQYSNFSSSVGRVGRVREVMDDSSFAKNEVFKLDQLFSKENEEKYIDEPAIIENKKNNINNHNNENYINNKKFENFNITVFDENHIEGTIISTIENVGYRRFLWEKIIDRYFYSQHVNDTQNTIYVQCMDQNGNISNKKIFFYGQVRGGIGIFRTGMRIKGEGRYNRQNEFMAKSLVVDDNIIVRFRTEAADIMYFLSPLLFVLLIYTLFNAVNLFQSTTSNQNLKWLLFCIAGVLGIFYYITRRISRRPVLSWIKTFFGVCIILCFLLFFFGKFVS